VTVPPRSRFPVRASRKLPGRRTSRAFPVRVATCLAILTLAGTQPAFGQDFSVRGTVADSAGAGIANAMVVALSGADSVLVRYALADGDGRFTLRDLAPGDYILQVTSMGYLTIRQDLVVESRDVDAGRVVMQVAALEMDPLVVSAEQVPFVNRRDTLDYNAAAFQVRPNATVEDLLARLPGVTVDDDGTITAQGEEVTQVLVDGKEFFGSDPTIATRNLPADAVDRVQIYDRRSDMAEFTGIEDGQEERTVNLQLREAARRGVFGSVSGALGGEQGGAAPVGPATEDEVRYQQSFSVNRFTPSVQLALVGGTNNINEAGFSLGDIQGFFGGGGGRGGGGAALLDGGRNNGFTTTKTVGANLGINRDNARWIRSSYFFSDVDNTLDRVVQREQLLGSQVASSLDQTTGQTTENQSHRFNVNAQYRFTDGHDVRLRGSFAAGSSGSLQHQSQQTTGPDGSVINNALSIYDVDGNNLSGTAQVTWRKRLADNGRSLVFEARGNLSTRDQNSNLDSRIGTPDPANVLTYDEILQLQDQQNDRFNESQRLSLTQPLGGSRVMELFAERSSTSEDQRQSVFDVAGATPVFDDLLSSELDQTYRYLRGGLRLSRNTDRSFLTLGAQVQRSELDGRIQDRDEAITRDFTHVLPNANFRYELRDGWNFSARYVTSTREPDTQELQPYTDNTDPLSAYTGNPSLQPEYRHTLNVDQRYFDQFTFRNVFAYARLTFTDDAIALSRTVDARGVQQVSPVNTTSSWTTNGGVNLSEPIRRIGAELSLGYDVLLSRADQVLNGEENETRILRNTLSVSLENRRKTDVSLEGGARFNFNDVEYSLSPAQNQDYLNTTLFGDFEWYPGGVWTVATAVNHQIFDAEVFGAQDNLTLWEASVSRMFLDERAEIQLVAFDLLDQNQGVSFTNSANFIQESRTGALGRHVMLRFVYRLGRTPPRGAGISRAGDRPRRSGAADGVGAPW
jgi:hypothetical protein